MLTNVILPKWLDYHIFNDLRAKYCRSNSDMTVIDWDKNDILNYLGTYFPRSYTESYCIFSEYFSRNKEFYTDKTSLSVFDFGCGTGGEIIGLITAVKEQLPKVNFVYVKAFDGNAHALRILESITTVFCKKIGIDVSLSVSLIKIDDFYDLTILDHVLDRFFDVIVSFKAICEFVTKDQFEQKNPYEHISSFLIQKLESDGIFVLADVTTYNHTSNEWLPKMMDSGLGDVPCRVVHRNVGYSQAFYVSHSQMANDLSKITWRIIKN